MGRHKKQANVSGIYQITNTTNGKVYVGSSINLTKRWWEHKKQLRLGRHCNVHMQNAWNQVGEPGFSFKVIKDMTGCGLTELQQEEQRFIDKWWDGGDKCYNMARVADRPSTTNINKQAVLQVDKLTGEVIREWDSAAEAERMLGASSCGIRGACKGRKITAFGFKWRYKDPNKSKRFPEMFGQHGGHCKKKVVMVDVNGTIVKQFESMASAGNEIGVAYNAVSGVCSGRRKHVLGYMFKFITGSETTATTPTKPKGDSLGVLQCLVCKLWYDSERRLATHLQTAHKIRTEQYTVDWLLNGTRPCCNVEDCLQPVRYSSFKFKTYCKEHSYLAEQRGGRLSKPYSKKTKTTHHNSTTPSVVCCLYPEPKTQQEMLKRYGSTEPFHVRFLNELNLICLSQELIKTLTEEDKERVVYGVFNLLRDTGMPFPQFSDDVLRKDWEQIKTAQSCFNEATKGFGNKRQEGLKLFRQFQSQQFYSIKEKGSVSMIDAFKDDRLLLKVLKNRVGLTYKETFGLSGAMIRQGFRSMRACCVGSVFNPVVARSLYKLLLTGNNNNYTVLDYSMGFGQRMVGALSLSNVGLYIGVDPWKQVIKANKDLVGFIGQQDRVRFVCDGAENIGDKTTLKHTVDLAFSSPPYYNKEIYGSMADTGFPSYKAFLDWWKIVTIGVETTLKPLSGLFAVNVSADIADDMRQVVEQHTPLKLKDTLFLEVSTSHFAKRNNSFSHKLQQQPHIKTEPIMVFGYNFIS